MIVDPLGLLLDAYERHGPVFSLRILNARNVFMLGPEANHFMLVSHADHFRWRDGGFGPAREALLPHLPLIAFEQQPGIGLALRKACLQRRGLIDGGGVRPPAPGLPEALREQVERHVDVVISGGL